MRTNWPNSLVVFAQSEINYPVGLPTTNQQIMICSFTAAECHHLWIHGQFETLVGIQILFIQTAALVYSLLYTYYLTEVQNVTMELK